VISGTIFRTVIWPTGIEDRDTDIQDSDRPTGIEDRDTDIQDSDTGIEDSDTGFQDSDTGIEDSDTGIQAFRVISMNLKLGGINKCLEGV